MHLVPILPVEADDVGVPFEEDVFFDRTAIHTSLPAVFTQENLVFFTVLLEPILVHLPALSS